MWEETLRTTVHASFRTLLLKTRAFFPFAEVIPFHSSPEGWVEVDYLHIQEDVNIS